MTLKSTTEQGRWRREHRAGRSRYYVWVGPVKVRVPWIAWALFS